MKLYDALNLPLLVLLFLVASQASMGQSLTFDKSTYFSGSGNCAFCHTSLKDQAANDVSIDNHWRSTMMANAAKDPYFLAKVSAEIQKFPALQSVIEDKCATCHTPMATTQAIADGEPNFLFGEGFLNEEHELHGLAQDGVSCTVCHQMQATNLGEEASFSGGYEFDLETAAPDRPIFGPYQDPFTQNMRSISGYTPVFGEHTSKSEICATCHTLYTPYLDDDGQIAGTFPEQTVYLEWRHSQFGEGKPNETHCQSCHMPQADGGVVISPVPSNLDSRVPFSQHHFVGGNVFMIDLMNQNRNQFDLTANEEHFNKTKARTLAQLTSKTALLEWQSVDISANQLSAFLMVAPQTGHKFPAGFPSRRAWIHLQVLDADASVIFESGKPLEDGRIQGNNADEDATLYEPHHEMITRADQVQIYEPILQDVNGDVTYTLLRASGYLKDNRLLPSGFDKKTAASDFATYGNASEDEDFDGGVDVIAYKIDLGDAQQPFTIKAELLYQTLSYPYIRDFESVDTPEVQLMLELYQQQDKIPVQVHAIEKSGLDRPTTIDLWKKH